MYQFGFSKVPDQYGYQTVSLSRDQKSAFNELLTCELTPIINELFTYNTNDRIWEKNPDTGSITNTNALVTVSSGVTANSNANIKSHQRIRYRPGMGVMCRWTALFSAGVAGTEIISGVGDENDGFFFGYNGTNFGILHRNKASGTVVDTWINQTDWNNDPINASNDLPTRDFTKGNIFEVRFQYLGFGQISFYIENENNGKMILVHDIKYANSYSIPSLSNPSLPFMLSANNKAVASDVNVSCCSVGMFIEGKSHLHGLANSVNNLKTGVSATETNILTLKNNTIYETLTNTNLIYPRFVSLSSIAGTKPCLCNITLNATLGGVPSYSDVDTKTSISSFDIAGTTVTGGYLLSSFILGKEESKTINLSDLDLFLSAGDILTISASTSSGTVEIHASVTYVEDI